MEAQQREDRDALRRIADGVRQAVWLLRRPETLQNQGVEDMLAVLQRDLDALRERLWVETGHESKQVRDWLRRTQPVRLEDN
jgi:hypothetical protein